MNLLKANLKLRSTLCGMKHGRSRQNNTVTQQASHVIQNDSKGSLLIPSRSIIDIEK